jgi:hypothetical protein
MAKDEVDAKAQSNRLIGGEQLTRRFESGSEAAGSKALEGKPKALNLCKPMQ